MIIHLKTRAIHFYHFQTPIFIFNNFIRDFVVYFHTYVMYDKICNNILKKKYYSNYL